MFRGCVQKVFKAMAYSVIGNGHLIFEQVVLINLIVETPGDGFVRTKDRYAFNLIKCHFLDTLIKADVKLVLFREDGADEVSYGFVLRYSTDEFIILNPAALFQWFDVEFPGLLINDLLVCLWIDYNDIGIIVLDADVWNYGYKFNRTIVDPAGQCLLEKDVEAVCFEISYIEKVIEVRIVGKVGVEYLVVVVIHDL